MDKRLAPKYRWSDERLAEAVRTSGHWRGVARALGIQTNSEGVMRRIRRDASRLRLDISHFKSSRTWSDPDLIRACTHAQTWDDVLSSLSLGTPGKETLTRLKGHAARLGLDVSHLEARKPGQFPDDLFQPTLRHLPAAGPALAAAWFMIRGCTASFPVEPAAFDLLASAPSGVQHVQVKTTTAQDTARSSWQVRIGRRPHSVGNKAALVPYDPDEIDLFFIVDGDLNMYLIPSRDIAGRTSILTRAYQRYIVGNVKEMIGAPGTAASKTATASAATASADPSANGTAKGAKGKKSAKAA